MSYARAPPPALAAASSGTPAMPDGAVDQQRHGWPAQGPSTSPVSPHPSPIDAPELVQPPATTHHAALQKFPQHHYQQQLQNQQNQQHTFPHPHHAHHSQQVQHLQQQQHQQQQQQQHPQRQVQHVHANAHHMTQQQPEQQQAHHQQYYPEPEQPSHYPYVQRQRDGQHQGENGRIASGGRAVMQAASGAQPIQMAPNALVSGSDPPPQRMPQQHLGQQQLPTNQSHGQAPDSTAGNGEHTFAILQESILSHVFFPLVLKKVYEVFANKPMAAPNSDPHFTDLEHRALGLKSYAEVYGLDGACERWASTDVFMAAMVSALSGLRASVATGPINPLLAETLSMAGAAVRNIATQSHAPGVAPTFASHQDAPEQLLAPLMPGGERNDLGIAAGRIARSRFLGSVPPPPRRKLKPVARRCLEDWFQTHIDSPYPSEAEKQELAEYCQLDIQQVNNFFGNKRMRMKRKMMSLSTSGIGRREPGGSKQQTPGDSILAPKSKWKAVVLSQLNPSSSRDVIGVSGQQGTHDVAVAHELSDQSKQHPDGSVGEALRRDSVPSLHLLPQRRMPGGDSFLL